MNITIDTDKKTITINGEADAQELACFVCRNNMKEYKVVEKAKLKEFDNLPDWIKEPPTITSPNIWKAYPDICLFVNTDARYTTSTT